MTPAERKTWDAIKATMLRKATVTATSSAALLDAVEKRYPFGHGDTIRHAYWSLVSDGLLIREPDGVRRGTP